MFGTQPYEIGDLPKTSRSLRIPQLPFSAQQTSRPLSFYEQTISSKQDDLIFTLEQLRSPPSKQTKELKSNLDRLRQMYKRINEDFLNNRIVPRLVVVIAEHVDIGSYKPSTDQQWQPQHHLNITINLNKYIAKYDYDIAHVLHATTAKRTAAEEFKFKQQAVFEILQMCSVQLAEGKKVFQSLWDTYGRQYNDLNQVPEDVKVLICSEMPMQDSACILRPRRERTCEFSSDFQVVPYQQIDPKSYSKRSEVDGMLTNEFVVKDWDTYFAKAAVGVEEKMNTTKLNWCDRNFKTWVQLNRDKIEPHNIL